MKNITAILNAFDVNWPLRNCFWGEWNCNPFPPAPLFDWPRFQNVEQTLRRALGPHISKRHRYRLSFISRFCEKVDDRFVARHFTPLLTVRIGEGDSGEMRVTYGRRPRESSTVSFPACRSCQGLGSAGGANLSATAVPRQILEMHGALAAEFKAPQFDKLRDHRGGMIISGLQVMEGLQGPEEMHGRKAREAVPGLFQILFIGTVIGFGSRLSSRIALVHVMDAWNYPIMLTGTPDDVWNYPENVERQPLALADALGVDPNNPREHAAFPWREPCSTCRGRGTP